MREQSHKNEMRAALRGDFERLRARQSGGPTMPDRAPQPRDEPSAPEPAEPPEPKPEPLVSPPLVAVPDPAPSPLPEPESHAEPPVPTALEPEPDPDVEAAQAVRRSRFRSFFRRD